METSPGEIRLFAGARPPAGWAFCDGRVLPVAGNEDLFKRVGSRYGGDGQSTFALPDLRGRAAVGAHPQRSGYQPGQKGGLERVTLDLSQMPTHHHGVNCQGVPGNANSPEGGLWAPAEQPVYAQAPADTAMNPKAIGVAGGGHDHDNMMPFLVLNYIIALGAETP